MYSFSMIQMLLRKRSWRNLTGGWEHRTDLLLSQSTRGRLVRWRETLKVRQKDKSCDSMKDMEKTECWVMKKENL